MIRVLTSGAVVNFALVILGATVGIFLKKGIPERIQQTLMYSVALCVLFIGIKGLFEDSINVLIIIISTAVGAVIGELLNLDRLTNKFGQTIENKLSKNGESKIAEGFVSATLLFCVGAMTVVGCIDSGISGDNATLYTKSLIDLISSAVLASTFGFGVLLSCFSVLIIEGTLTLFAAALQPILSTAVISHISVIGSMLIIALSFNMLGITKIKIMNIIPAVFIPIILCNFM
ncbi:MAG: DUF554 domain-containing protein [Clostridia bacterium]|nr:DUF554 domain-containing protein [Clostridia bacterium]